MAKLDRLNQWSTHLSILISPDDIAFTSRVFHVSGLTSSDEQQRSGSNGSRTSLPASHPAPSNDHKAAITLGIIMGVFLVCWVPFFCMNIILAFCKTCVPELVFKILTWLGWSNSALNPIIYSIFNTEFRDAFRKILIQTLPDDWCQSIFGMDLRANNRSPTWLSSNRAHHPHHHSSLRSDSNQESSDLHASANREHKRPFKVKLMPPQLVRQGSGNRKCTTLIQCGSVNESGDHNYSDALPVKDRFEILCGATSEGKISAIWWAMKWPLTEWTSQFSTVWISYGDSKIISHPLCNQVHRVDCSHFFPHLLNFFFPISSLHLTPLFAVLMSVCLCVYECVDTDEFVIPAQWLMASAKAKCIHSFLMCCC